MFLRVVLCLLVSSLISPIISPSIVFAQGANGGRAIVFDERLSALRERPDSGAKLRQRLRRGRTVWVIGSARSGDGQRYLRVAVTRRTSGWILREAVIRPGSAQDAARLLKLVEASSDDFVRIRLARICADEFRGTAAAARALLLLGEAAERAAERLSRQVERRVGANAAALALERRVHLLNDPALDRYNRIGVRFVTDGEGDRLLYDGGAYRELIRKYPRRPEAAEAREKLKTFISSAVRSGSRDSR